VPFLADGLTRFGYLPNPLNPDGLPVGFMASGPLGSRTLGMNCSACHTRQITVEGQPYRVDGGPAFADFQNFLTALDVAVGKVVEDPAAFQTFAAAVLGAGTDADDVAQLRQQVTAWYERYHTLIDRALPKPPAQLWGPARLDAVGMIFNRLSGSTSVRRRAFSSPTISSGPTRPPAIRFSGTRRSRTGPSGPASLATATTSSRLAVTSDRCSACSASSSRGGRDSSSIF